MEKCFFDTNILLYTLDAQEPEKQNEAKLLIKEFTQKKKGIISTQSLQEFSNIAIKKFKYPKENVLQFVDILTEKFKIYRNSIKTIKHALKISIKSQISFWDSLILAAANEADCKILYSEDLNAGQIIDGVKIVNPFKE